MKSQSATSVLMVVIGTIVFVGEPIPTAGQSSDQLYLPPVVGVTTSPETTNSNIDRTSSSAGKGQVTDTDLLPKRSKDEKASNLPNNLMGAGGGSVTTMVGSLAVVLGLFLILAWFAKRSMPAGQRWLASEVVEVLGRAPLSGKQSMHLVRLGQKLLLVSVTPQGSQTLSEITAPEEVERLLSLCQRNSQGSVSESFRDVLTQFEHESVDGFLEPQTQPESFGARA